MNEVRKFLGALRNLKEDFGMNGGGFIEYATRMGALIELADEERRPVADKALSLWLESGTQHCKGWLREQTADVILQSVGPCVEKIKCGAIIGDFESVKEALKTHSPDWVQLTRGGILLEIDGFNIPRFCGGYHTLTPAEQVLPSYSAVVDAVAKTHYPLREECADAAQWFYQVKDAAMPGGPRWLKNNPADWIISRARAHLEALNTKRQPVADAAQVLFTVFGRKAESFIIDGLVPVATLSLLESIRGEHADAAQAFWMIAPEPNAGVTMNRTHSELLRDARYWRDLMMVKCMEDAIAISNGLPRPKASDRIRKIAELLLEEVAANESR